MRWLQFHVPATPAKGVYPHAPRFIEYKDHAENYGTELNPHEAGH